MYELTAHQVPWDSIPEHEQIFGHVADGRGPQLSPKCLEDAPDGWRELMESCWHQTPNEWPGFDAIYTKLAIMRAEALEVGPVSAEPCNKQTIHPPVNHIEGSSARERAKCTVAPRCLLNGQTVWMKVCSF